MWLHICDGTPVEIREQFVGVDSALPPTELEQNQLLCQNFTDTPPAPVSYMDILRNREGYREEDTVCPGFLFFTVELLYFHCVSWWTEQTALTVTVFLNRFDPP